MWYIINDEYSKCIMKKDKVKIVIGVIVGGIAGYSLYRFVGCKTGTCIITSKPDSLLRLPTISLDVTLDTNGHFSKSDIFAA